MMKIFGDLRSGNCLKVKYTADYLNIPYEWVPVDITKGESKTSDFLARNPMGQVPSIELADGRCIAQSNAIIRYLANGTKLLPQDAFAQAKVDELLFWEQYSHEPYIAVCRFHMFYLGRSADQREAQRVERGESALDLMDSLLQGREWFTGTTMNVADIALLAYTRVAHEGGFDLSSRPNIRSWIERCDETLQLSPVH
jgi:glutathione S-transferase